MTHPRSAPPPSQRGLFDDAAPAPAAAPAAVAAVAPPAPPVPRSARPTNNPKPQAGLAPEVFRHPQADREIRLHGHLVAYALRRARRRSIGFVVGSEGLAVSAPRWVGIGSIEDALRDKAAWILRKLAEQRERVQQSQAARVDWRDGTSIPFLGDAVVVVLDPRVVGAMLDSGEAAMQAGLAGVARRTLHVGLPHDATPAQIRDVVQSWLQRQARRVFEERCRHFAARIGVRWTRLALSSAQTRWGSASASGAIRLNWRLIHFAMPTIDYVVAHELAHLREMNHGPRFWDVVRSVVPQFEDARGALKDEVLPVLE